MRLELIEGIRLLIIAFLSYIPTVTIPGWFEAWSAKKLGDDLPERFGFLTFDPFVHFNLVGFAFLLMGKLFGDYLTIIKDIPGWGRYIPIVPTPSVGRFKHVRVVAEFLARSFAHFVLLLVAFFTIIFVFKGSVLYPIKMISHETALFESLRLVLRFFFEQNLILCIIYFVIGVFRTILYFWFPDVHMFSSTNALWVVVLLFVAVMFGAHLVEWLLLNMLAFMEYSVSSW